mmetsp:Transcript_18297/g.60128  ORF Transcript_18297/g.60128 Transcript_18297/m.60128 type:complete len:151 (-) Transcript_18297:402-854(-)
MHTHSLMCMTENCCLQDLHAYNQDPKKRSTYEKIKFHISPHIEQQRLARRQQDSFEREQRVRMVRRILFCFILCLVSSVVLLTFTLQSEEKKWEEEYFRTDVHQKRVERYHEFANNVRELYWHAAILLNFSLHCSLKKREWQKLRGGLRW